MNPQAKFSADEFMVSVLIDLFYMSQFRPLVDLFGLLVPIPVFCTIFSHTGTNGTV